MEHRAKTLATVQTIRSGLAEITCGAPGAWTFDAKATADDGRDVVTVRITSPTNAVPPAFGVYFRVSGAGVQNVWTGDANKDGFHLRPKLWWRGNARNESALACNTPIAVGFNAAERAPVAMACSDAFNEVVFGLYADDETCDIIGRCEFFAKPSSARSSYEVSVLFDRRNGAFADVVRDCTAWIRRVNGFRPTHVPEAAFDPLYSTWYAYLQDVRADELEREAREAVALGMKTMILDDGWQKVESRSFYSATGDWMPVESRFSDMRRHVDAVHRTGLRYMLWLAVPFVGAESKAYARFVGKFLNGDPETGVLDPRFPEAREYLVSTYERVIRDWDFDGVKLDFIDSFRIDGPDPALRDGYAGRDYRDIPSAVNRLMTDVLARLRAIKPDVLVEMPQNAYTTFDFDKAAEIIEKGRELMSAALDKYENQN